MVSRNVLEIKERDVSVVFVIGATLGYTVRAILHGCETQKSAATDGGGTQTRKVEWVFKYLYSSVSKDGVSLAEI